MVRRYNLHNRRFALAVAREEFVEASRKSNYENIYTNFRKEEERAILNKNTKYI